MKRTPPLLHGATLMFLTLFAGFACNRPGPATAQLPEPAIDLAPAPAPAPGSTETPATATAVFAGGCFWCTESVFEQLRGVNAVVSGYAGGTAETADYKKVSSGATDHAEAIAITYDPAVITYGQLLRVFFGAAHDPTQLNRQGPDHGRQYRSAVFYADEEQKRVTEAYIQQLTEAEAFDAPIVTTLEPLEKFYKAEAYHQDYVVNNPAQPYVVYNSLPKVEKVRKEYPKLLKAE